MACICKNDDKPIVEDDTTKTTKGSPAVNNMETEPSARDFLHLVQQNYRILPMFQHSLTHYKPVLDLEKNEFLAKQWDQFLDNVPTRYVKIRLFNDMLERVSLARRKSLNGKSYYNHEEKLVPVPLDHTRNGGLKSSKC